MVFGLLKKLLSRYDGELKDGKRHGQGTYKYAAGKDYDHGKKYEGEWIIIYNPLQQLEIVQPDNQV